MYEVDLKVWSRWGVLNHNLQHDPSEKPRESPTATAALSVTVKPKTKHISVWGCILMTTSHSRRYWNTLCMYEVDLPRGWTGLGAPIITYFIIQVRNQEKETLLLPLLGGPPRGFFMRDVHRKSFAQRSKSQRNTARRRLRIADPTHTDVVADHAQHYNYVLLNVGIGTCLNVAAWRILLRMPYRWRNFDLP